MLTLLTLKTLAFDRPDTADTGTFADGAIPYSMMEAQKSLRRLNGRDSFNRDYGAKRCGWQDTQGYA